MVSFIKTEQRYFGGFQDGNHLIRLFLFESCGRGDGAALRFVLCSILLRHWCFLLILNTPAEGGQKRLVGGHGQISGLTDMGGDNIMVLFLKK